MRQLSRIANRAMQVAACQVHDPAAAVEDLSLTCYALSSLAHHHLNDTREASTLLAVVTAATACNQELLALCVTLPPEIDFSYLVSDRLLRVVQASATCLPLHEQTRRGVLEQVCTRTSRLALTAWTPQQQLRLLYCIAITSRATNDSALSQSFPLLQDCLLHLPAHVRQYNEKEIPRLLWCLAVLRLEASPLWDISCRRSSLLFGKMNRVGRATVLQAMLVVGTCSCRSQEFLLATVLEVGQEAADTSQREGASSGEVSSMPLLDADNYGKICQQLMQNSRLIGTDALTGLVAQLWAIDPGSEGGSQRRTSRGNVRLSDEVLYLLEHISRRQISPQQAVNVLQLLVDRGLFAANIQHMECWEALRAVCVRGVEALRGVGQAFLHDPLAALQTLTHVAFSFLTVALSTGAPLLSAEEDAHLWSTLGALVETCIRGVERDLHHLPGDTCWHLVCALTLLSMAQENGVPPVIDSNISVDRLLEVCQRLWQPSASVLEPCAMLVETACVQDRGLLELVGSKLTCASRRVFTDAVCFLQGVTTVPLPLIIRLLVAAETASPTVLGPISAPLIPSMVRLLEQREHDTAPLLREVRRLLGAMTHRPSGAGALCVPDPLLELFIRLLAHEARDGTLAPQHLEALLTCLEQRSTANDVPSLERAFVMLFTRRLGELQPFVEMVTLPPRTISRLVALACQLHSAHVDTSTAILSVLFDVLCRDNLQQCGSLSALHDVAALLDLSVCEELGVRQPLAQRVAQRAMQLMKEAEYTAIDKALIVAYIIRANLDVPQELLEAMRA